MPDAVLLFEVLGVEFWCKCALEWGAKKWTLPLGNYLMFRLFWGHFLACEFGTTVLCFFKAGRNRKLCGVGPFLALATPSVQMQRS